MTDNPQGPAADSGDPATAGSEPVVDPAVPDSGSDRRNVVYLVPTMSRPAEIADADDDPRGTSLLPANDRDIPAGLRDSAGGASPTSGAYDPNRDAPAELAEHADPDGQPEREDWAWVQEWRAGQEPTPWATGVALAVFSALIVGVAVWVLSAGLADRPVIAVLVNLLVAGGLTPAIWLSRGLPVLRWIAAGAAAGIVIGWVSAILMLPFPTA